MKLTGIKIFVFVFILIISTPLILVNLRIKVDPINSGEKKISMNFKRNFPLKSDLFITYSTIKTEVFNTNPLKEKAIDMKNGWKFLGNDFSNALSESKGLVVFTKKELKHLKKNLLNRKKWLNEQGIKFYIAIAPNKHSVYGDMIPIKKYDRFTKLEQLDSLCKTISVNFINLGSQYPKDSKIRLYHKTDSHWNDYAGFFGFKATMDLITKDFENQPFKLFSLNDLELETINEPIGDLNEMLQLKKSEDFIHLNFKEPQKAVLQEKKLRVPFNYHKNPSFYETRYKNDINNLKILVFNDSFFGYYGKYLSENFGDSVFIWNYIFDKKLITSEKPDILYHEIVERDIDFLLVD